MPLGSDSGLCLSCHDGTIAVADTVLFGQMPTRGTWMQGDNFTTHLQSSHPFSLVKPIQDDIDLVASLVTQGKTGDKTGAVQLILGNVECTSCHNPHVQAIDKLSMNFLVRDSSNGQMCLACHDPTRTSLGGNNQVNPLAGWAIGAHNIATNRVSSQAKLGSYGTVAGNACISCHAPHNGQGAARLLRATNEQDCVACHSGGSNLAPALPDVFAEFRKIGHPFPSGTNLHDAAENPVLNNNRHATCADCHNSHGAEQVMSFNVPPLIRVSQTGAVGIATDGTTVVNPAVNQYENCLRCHGYSAGKAVNPSYGYLPARSAADPLNVIPQMNANAKIEPSGHARPQQRIAAAQPAAYHAGLSMAAPPTAAPWERKIFCTDCHNSDDNREFGRTGPEWPTRFEVVAHSGTRLRRQPGPGRPGHAHHHQFESAARSQRERTIWHVREVSQPEHRDAEPVLVIS